MINGNTKVLGLIGNPVTHTLSPLIHNSLAKMMDMNLIYVPFLVSENLEEAIKGAFNLNIEGMNVTVPYKTEVIKSLGTIDKEAELIGAVNTLVRTDYGYKGYNTDLAGLYQALESEDIHVTGNKVIIIGAGGAARAAAFLCAKKSVKKLVIANRTVEHAQSIVKELQEKLQYNNATAISIQDMNLISDNDYIALQATNVGLSPNTKESPIMDGIFFDKLSAVYDFIYKPGETKFMKLAKEHGVPAFNGLKMLLYQGVCSFELWTQRKVSADILEKTYDLLLKELESNE